MIKSLYIKALGELFMYNKTDYKITNIVNYVRKSRRDEERERKTGEDTLHEQKKLMAKILDDYAIPYVQMFEVGSGDKIATRPVFQEVLKELKVGTYDAVAVKEISRLGRGSMSDMGIIYDLLVENRIYIITPSRIYDPRNSSDQRQIRFEMFFAREEFEQIRERLTGARYSAAMEGKWMGQIPFGYNRNPKTLRLEPNEDEANVVRLMFDLFVNGYEGKEVRERAIATILKRLGITTAKDKQHWDTTQIKRVLTNEAYIGIARFRTTEKTLDGKVIKRPQSEHIIVPDAHEPIIKESVFYEVQKIKQEKAIPRTKFDVDNYELTGLLSCKHCDKKLVVNRYNRKRRSGTSYIDMYVRCRNGCITVKYDVVEEKVIGLLKYLSELNEELLNEMYEATTSKQDQNERELYKAEIIRSIEQKKVELQKRLKFIQEKHFNGVYSDEDYLGFKKQIDQELKEVQKMEEGNGFLEASATKEKINVKKVKKSVKNILSAYNSLDSSVKKNQLLRSTFDDIVLTILEKGTKSKEPKLQLEPTLSFQFWQGLNV
jgi:DNA invertase Pin-like site-specific DNA recombinase